jgi:hypothetical protein
VIKTDARITQENFILANIVLRLLIHAVLGLTAQYHQKPAMWGSATIAPAAGAIHPTNAQDASRKSPYSSKSRLCGRKSQAENDYPDQRRMAHR